MTDMLQFKNLRLNLEILAEECAEVSQIKSKIIRFGIDDVYPARGHSNRDALAEECGHVLAMVRILTVQGIIDGGNVEKAAQAKLDRLPDWYGKQPGPKKEPIDYLNEMRAEAADRDRHALEKATEAPVTVNDVTGAIEHDPLVAYAQECIGAMQELEATEKRIALREKIAELSKAQATATTHAICSGEESDIRHAAGLHCQIRDLRAEAAAI